MKTGRIFWGSFFITLGFLYFFTKYEIIIFDWEFVWDLWPLIFVFWGLLIIARDWSLKPVISGLFGFYIAVQVFGTVVDSSNIFEFDEDFDFSYNNYEEEYTSDIQEATLRLEGGAGKFIIDGDTDKLYEAHARGIGGNFDFNYDTDNGKAVIKIEQRKKNFRFFHNKIRNKLNLSLNNNPVWDVNVSLGAASGDFDFRDIKIDNLSLETGAADLTVRLGTRFPHVNFKVEMGVASLNIYIPKNAGCRLEGNMGLVAKDIQDLNKIDSNLYESDNYETADRVIDINIKGAVAKLKIQRY